MDTYLIEVLGFLAGFTTLCASLPQLLANLRDPKRACAQSPARNALQSAGNALWLVYAMSTGSIAMMCFSTLGCLMGLALLAQTWKGRSLEASLA